MPTLHTVLLDLLYAGATAAIGFLAPKAKAFFESHTTASERQTLEGLASAAVPFVERAYSTLDGAAKMHEAIAFVDRELTALHIPLTATGIEAAIEKAYADATKAGILKPYATSAANAKKAATPVVDPTPVAPVTNTSGTPATSAT